MKEYTFFTYFMLGVMAHFHVSVIIINSLLKTTLTLVISYPVYLFTGRDVGTTMKVGMGGQQGPSLCMSVPDSVIQPQ